jgi:hypothetical protein
MPPDARWFLVWERDEKIYEEEIPDPPKVRLRSAKRQEGGVMLSWRSTPAEGLCYLVHWEDRKHRAWRGVAPRQEDASLLLPRELFVDGPDLRVRIYASSGIATGYTEETIRLDDGGDGGGDYGGVGGDGGVTLTLDGTHPAGPDDEGGARPIPCVLSVVATDAAGRQLPNDRITWYDSSGGRLESGPDIDLRTLPKGRHVVRAVLRSYGGPAVAKSWLVERTADGCWLHSVMCDPPPKSTPEDHDHPHPAPEPCQD